MARPLRIEYPNAIYHVLARDNAKQAIFHIEDDYRRMVDGLSKTVGRTGWEVFAYVWMPNHIQLNPVCGRRPLVSHPRDWPWSSYPGFCSKAKQADWIEYDDVLNAWQADQVPKVRKLSSLNATEAISIVAEYFGTTVESFQTRRTASVERDIAAWMAHRRTTSTVRELSDAFGLRHPDSVSNFIRRAEAAINQSANIANQIKHLNKLLSKTENRV